MKKAVITGVLLSLLLLMFTSCDINPQPKSETYYEYFGTVSSVICYREDTEAEFRRVADKVDTLLSEYHTLYDIYHEYSGINNIATVNRYAGIMPVEVDDRIIDLLLYAKEVYELTSGEVNVAMGSVLKLWHEAREGNGDGTHTLPTDEELIEASLHTDICSILIDEAAGTVFVTDRDASIDVGAIAKGYATERIAEALVADEEIEADGYALNIGGNIRLIGSKGGEEWRIGITNPDRTSDDPYVMRISVKNTSIVTSGDYERYFTVDGKNYHHIIDKDTLYPSKYFHSVTVVTEDSALADALSTALFSMHINDGYKLITSLDGVEAMWVNANGAPPTTTPGFPKIED
ncbi:MAG: FAD:protein FMN transferase [Clostridia bacterium]|nr:FAD:protein FMN transferase [Clostridia bacterium]